MRNNKMKGFTLVELLVVIAILAILATVSVVGYTSYIESTNITVDENLAAQLNRFLEAYKVNFTGDIDENNIREVTLEILKEGGLEGQLIARSKDRDFYFDLEKDEYVLLEDEKSGIKTAGYKVLFGLDTLAADEPKFEVKLENCFTPNNQYFYVGSASEDAPISLIIDAFYKFNPDPANHKVLVSKINNLDIPALSTFVENAVVVTDECNYRLGNDPKYVIFAPGINQIGTKTVTWENGWSDPATADKLATVTGKLTIPASVKFFEANALNCGANAELHINKTAEQVSKMASDLFTDSKLIVKDGTFYAEVLTSGLKGITNKSAENLVEYAFHYENNLASFGATLSGTDKKYQNVSLSEGYIAWQDGITVKIDATKFVGEDPNIPATGTEGIVWTSNTTGVTVDANNVIKVDFATANKTTEVELVGTATNGKTHTYKLNFVYPQSFDYTIDGDSVTENKDTGISLLYSATASTGGKTSFPIAVVLGDYNVTGTGIEVELAYSFTATNFKQNGAAVEVVNADFSGEETITIKTIGYEDKAIKLKLFNADSLVFSTKNENIIFVADGNAITLGTLFSKNDGKTIPNGAQVWIVSDLGDTPFDFNGSEVFATQVNLDSDNWEDTEIQFTDGQNDFTDNNQSDFSVVIVADGYRISTDHKVSVVTGVNVDSFADLNSSKNNVLISNISDLPANYAGFTLNSGNTLYGNAFSIDMTGYDDDGTPQYNDDGTPKTFYFTDLKKTVQYSTTTEALITLNNATLSNVKIVGEVYKSADFLYQTPEQFAYGASLVKANDGSMIDGCYLANCRSPLKVTGTVTVQNSTLFGGNYANIDVAATKNSSDKLVKTELILKGTVTTINQVIEGVTDETLGVGIVVDLFAHKDSKVTIESKNTLDQYNYVEKSQASLLPIVTYTMDLDKLGTQDVNVKLSDEVGKVYKDYRDWVFVQGEGENKKEYFNTGVIFLNGMTFNVTNDAGIIDGILKRLFGSSQGNGDNVTNLPDGYVKDYTTVERSASKKVLFVTITMSLKEYVYIHSPQNTVAFNNTIPETMLPSKNLGQ